MKVTKTAIDGVLYVETPCFWDGRGMFEESYNADTYFKAGLPTLWPQDNVSYNPKKNVLRGLHMQSHKPMGKLIRCLKGSIQDVAVDINGNHVSVVLDHPSKGLYVPAGMFHGFLTLADDTLVYYKCTTLYDKQSDGGILWNDPDLDIIWANSDPGEIIVSDKDSRLPTLREYNARKRCIAE